jgi:hypothetical protein
MAFTLMALWHALKALRRRDSVYRSGVGFGAAMGIIALLIHSSTDFNLQIPANAANTEGKINSSRRGDAPTKAMTLLQRYGAPTKNQNAAPHNRNHRTPQNPKAQPIVTPKWHPNVSRGPPA